MTTTIVKEGTRSASQKRLCSGLGTATQGRRRTPTLRMNERFKLRERETLDAFESDEAARHTNPVLLDNGCWHGYEHLAFFEPAAESEV